MPGLTIASAPITGSRFIGSIRYVRAFRISTLPMWRNRGMLVDLSIELVLECLGHAIEDRCPSGVGFEDRFPNLFGFLPGQGEGDRHHSRSAFGRIESLVDIRSMSSPPI